MYDFRDQLEAGDVEAIDKLYRSGIAVSVHQHPLWPDTLQANQRIRTFVQRENNEI